MATVTGGAGHGPINLKYDSGSVGALNARALLAAVDKDFGGTRAVYESDSRPVNGSNDGGYMVVTKSVLEGEPQGARPIVALGFDAVTIQDNGVGATVRAGGDATLRQTVLAGDGGLTLTAATGNVSVAAGGGDNHIVFGSGHDSFYSTDGANTIIGGSGFVNVQAGKGFNVIRLESGNSHVESSGTDRILLGSGNETIRATAHGSDHVFGAASVTAGAGFTMTFFGGMESSTVSGGAGSYDISGGAGGGSFTGGAAGGNHIAAGTGNATIAGGGAYDTLSGGAGNDVIIAGPGNETLSGGGGSDEFAFSGSHGTSNDVITDFQEHGDIVHFAGFGSVNEDQYAAGHMTVANGSTTVSLSDGSTVQFMGVTNLGAHSFH